MSAAPPPGQSPGASALLAPSPPLHLGGRLLRSLRGLPRPTALGWLVLSTAISVSLLRPAGGLCDLLVAGMVSLWIAGLVLAFAVRLGRVEVRRVAPRVATKGETIELVHELRLSSGRPLQQLRIDERLGGGTFFHELVPGEKARAHARVFLPKRGRVQLGGVTLSCGDPFGLFEVQRTLELPAIVLVRPRPQLRAARRELARAGLRGTGGTNPLEWSAVRDFRTGDPVRLVHWRLTARRGFPIVRVSPAQRVSRAVLLLDRSPGATPADFERAVALCAGIAQDMLARGSELRFLAPGREPLRLERLRGSSGFARLLEALATVEVDARALASLDPSERLEGALVVSAREHVNLSANGLQLLTAARTIAAPQRRALAERAPAP